MRKRVIFFQGCRKGGRLWTREVLTLNAWGLDGRVLVLQGGNPAVCSTGGEPENEGSGSVEVKAQTHLGRYGFLFDSLHVISDTESSPAHIGRKLSVTRSCTYLTAPRQGGKGAS